jgi:cysteine-rich repeat protein
MFFACCTSRRLVPWMLLVWLAGCGGDKVTPGQNAIDTGSADTIEQDLGGTTDAIGFELSFDGTGGVCPGAAGCACQDNAECNIGFCLETPKGRRCASYCDQTCAGDFKCANVPVGNDVISMCIPRWGRLCEPCQDSQACRAALGSDDAACVEYGGLQGAFCGAACTVDGDCPGGYTCASATTVEGKNTKQCKKLPEPDGSLQCPCDVRAVEQGLATSCAAKAAQGTCPGTRVCSSTGLSNCTAAQAGVEQCNGVDDDCNGLTDDGLCDDKNPCTDDGCDGKTGACKNTANVLPCTDGNACTDKDTCQNGQCAGVAADCDDKNPCTSDTCDGQQGCQHALADNGACDDGNACTIGDLCLGGQCLAGKAKDCGDDNACTVDLCDSATGTCAHKALDGQPCTDGNACTDPDFCAGDVCQGKLKDCNDLNPCTDDSCDVTVGCVHSASTKPCNDSNACTGNDLCDGKGGCVGAAIDVSATCTDNNPCTADSCDAGQGCVHGPQASVCEDGNPCTNGDACTAGVCIPGQNICSCQTNADCFTKEDGDLCNGTLYCDKAAAPYVCKVDPATIVTCDASGDTTCSKTTCAAKTGLCGKTSQPDAKPCDADGSVCTVGDACAGGVCAAGASLSCDDKNPCTDDTCDGKAGCKNVANVAACSDGNACTVGDTCGSGLCVAGKKTVCDDGSGCTVDSCDVKTGSCVFDGAGQEGDPCDADGSVCTVGDKCATGVCKAGIAKNCDDQNECTNDSCDSKAGCLHVNNGNACDFDGSPCTPADLCKNGNCAPGPKKDCDDANPCTVDTCDAITGACKHNGAVLDDQACEDGDKCTKNDTCKSGVCTTGQAVDCNDADLCTVDSCEKLKGCLHTVVADGTPCNDGDACTLGDTCVADKCAGTKLDCEDKNACTIDSCAPTGCAHAAVTDGATVPGACDVNQYCVGAKCVTPGCGDGFLNAGEQCDDGNAKACDGCESCQVQGVLTLDGKGWASNAAKAGPPGTLQGALGLAQDLTLEAWVKPANFTANQPIAAKALTTGAFPWRFGLLSGSGKPYFAHLETSTEVVTGTIAVQAGQWAHVAVVVARDQVRFFVNGKPAGTGTLLQERHDVAGTPVVVGADALDASGLGAGALFVGSLDAVHLAAGALYGGTFTPTRKPGVVAATRALWLLDDGKGTTMADASGLGNPLTLGGTASLGPDSCYGAASDAGVCGDGKVAPAYETCDDANPSSCDGCEGCQARRVFDVAGKSALQLPALGSWAQDATCPTCETTIEAWVRFGTTSGVHEIVGVTCGYLSLHLLGGVLGVYRYPEPVVSGTTSIVPEKWYHVAATIGWAAGSETRLYVNGKLEKTAKASNAGPDMSKEYLLWGAGVGGGAGSGCVATGEPVVPGNYMNGQIDDARVSQGLRYTDGFIPPRRQTPDRQTRGLWHFDDAPASAIDDGGQGIAGTTLAGSSSYAIDQCLGEPASAATCGDSQKARWEGCDFGGTNGDYPKGCSKGCYTPADPDCTSLGWSGSQLPTGKNIMTYPNTTGAFTAWTLEGWTKIAQLPGSGVGIVAGVDGADLCPPMPIKQQWQIATTADGSDASFLAESAAAGASKTAHVWKAGTWQHFALQYHGLGKGSLYVDGVKVRDYASVPSAWASTCMLHLGGLANGTGVLAGQMASLRLSKTVRYGQPFNPAWTLGSDAATLWVFQMDTSTGTTQDDATNGINGTYHIDPKGGSTSTVAGPACGK